MSIQKIIKVGNSLGVTLPSRFVQNISLKAGDAVEITQSDDNKLTFNFPDSSQLPLINKSSISNSQPLVK
jgi:antitoxin component of MazEF toxin-antitoxin module